MNIMKDNFLITGLVKSFVIGLLTLWLTTSGAVRAESNAAAARPKADNVVKVVYHADFADPRRFSAMLTSINNMVSFYQDSLVDYDVRIVFISHGIRFVTRDKLTGTPFAEDTGLKERRENLLGRINTLRDTFGVKLELCGITREQAGLDQKMLITGVEIVRSGVVRIAELQHQGFAYIKVE